VVHRDHRVGVVDAVHHAEGAHRLVLGAVGVLREGELAAVGAVHDSAPHATGQCQQAYFFSIDSLTTGPFMFAMPCRRPGRPMPTPPQLRTGASPLIAELLVMPVVPKVVKNFFAPG
jgi:uncharacterized protein (DUF2249 family)